MSRLVMTAIIALILLAPFSPSFAAAPGTPVISPSSIDALTAAVNRLAAAMEAEQKRPENHESLERLNLAINYLSFRSRRIEGLDREIAQLKNGRINLEEALKKWTDRIEALEERQKETQGAERVNLDNLIEESKLQVVTFKERYARMGEEIIQAENRIVELQRELSYIENYVEDHLEFEE